MPDRLWDLHIEPELSRRSLSCALLGPHAFAGSSPHLVILVLPIVVSTPTMPRQLSLRISRMAYFLSPPGCSPAARVPL
jgi:hypothetical protein